MPLFEIGPQGTLHVFGIKLVGLNAENGQKLVITIVFFALVWLAGRLVKALSHRVVPGKDRARVAFWTRQGINLVLALTFAIGFLSIWFDDPARLATGVGLVTAGLAFALQKVVTSLAGYFVILRGRTFNVGDRIVMGGVRGDVVALNFTQTTIMEMGQPPGVQGDDPAMWVKSRQYTGRIVIVPNSKIFDEPVYNYTQDFPYIWEELTLPVSYKADRARAEQVLLTAARKHRVSPATLAAEDLRELQRRYFVVDLRDFEPKVYVRPTDNWLELTVRFLTRAHGVRDVKDAMSREILAAFDAAGIGVASATYEIVGLPPLELRIRDAGRATWSPPPL